jgi:hypothetical protein
VVFGMYASRSLSVSVSLLSHPLFLLPLPYHSLSPSISLSSVVVVQRNPIPSKHHPPPGHSSINLLRSKASVLKDKTRQDALLPPLPCSFPCSLLPAQPPPAKPPLTLAVSPTTTLLEEAVAVVYYYLLYRHRIRLLTALITPPRTA